MAFGQDLSMAAAAMESLLSLGATEEAERVPRLRGS